MFHQKFRPEGLRWWAIVLLGWLFVQPLYGQSKLPWLSGYTKTLHGEYIGYNTAIKGVNDCLLVRAIDREKSIAWESASIPEDYQQPYVMLVWLANYDHNNDRRKYDLSINGESWFTFTNNPESEWKIDGKDGAELRFQLIKKDPNGDYMGYQFLKLPVKSFEKGKPLSLQIAGESAGKPTWYMTVAYSLQSSINLQTEMAVLRKEEKLWQRIRVKAVYHGEPAPVTFEMDGKTLAEDTLHLGENTYYLWVDLVKEPVDKQIKITVAGQEPVYKQVALKPVKNYTVYFLPHSHVDIGYTHTQAEVEQTQWENMEKGIELARKTAHYPEGAQFKWNAEVMWAVDSYLRKAPEEKRKAMLDAIDKGWLALDGLYGSNLTGIERPEELMRWAGENTQDLYKKYGFQINSAMITDVPGYSWGAISALAHNGIKYFSAGPNHMPSLPHGGDRVGYTLEAWGDIPFYWETPSGKQKVLFWMTGHGYSWFHNWILGTISEAGGEPVLQHLEELDDNGYPYDMVYLRYTIGADNGPPDPKMSDFIKNWNETYEYPKFKISTTQEVFEKFEEKYGDQLPVLKGDFTPYWEDGAASSAKETAVNRDAAEKLVQAEKLWTMLKPEQYPFEGFYKAWHNAILYSEHTWGANISISQPDSEFTQKLWKVKQRMALDADSLADVLIDEGLKERSLAEGDVVEAIEVFNTQSWMRTDVVTVPADWQLKGDYVTDAAGKHYPSQRLQNGALVFVAEEVKPLGSTKFYFKKKKQKTGSPEGFVSEKGLSNGLVTIEIDPKNGDIIQWTSQGVTQNLVDNKQGFGWNHYVYTGQNAENPKGISQVTIEVKENGPVVKSLIVTSEAPGCNQLVTELKLIRGIDRLYIDNQLDKQDVREKENVRFAFPFQVPNGKMTLDMAWGSFEPEKGQLKGANKNFLTPQRWVDVSNETYGITWANPDAPLIEIGGMNGEAWMSAPHRPWIKRLEPSQLLYSWVMNNSWHTNYKASQGGKVNFRYVLRGHRAYSDTENKKFGIESSQPLLFVPVAKKQNTKPSFLPLPEETSVIVSSIRADHTSGQMIVRLFNTSSHPASLSLENWGKVKNQLTGASLGAQLSLSGWEIITLRIEKE
ncbi:glycoside hydrolase family 38 C-terminal domain-containing protein [Rapidithrix thailandica]|uniref:Glycoside hydrolase family 38 C-terminal domain-containing protein n=1 Tax=Rapidithrix thailandica TaxID=413964 RepID=A0AAW9SFS9_9BACT